MSTHTDRYLEKVVQKIHALSQQKEQVSVDNILEAIGRRSFGPLLLFTGLILAIPGVGDIPGMPTVLGLVIILTVGQQVVGRSHIWLPEWLLKRSVKKKYIEKSMDFAKKPAAKVDDWTTSRLSFLVDNKVSVYLSSLACISIAILTPAMEIVFFSANIAGVCLFLFGLAYVAHDGIVMLLSFTLYSSLIALLAYAFLI